MDIRYTDYFPEYAQYFVKSLRLLKSMYGMTNSGKLFAGDLKKGYLKQYLSNHNVRCLSIISMHHMDQKLFFYLMLMIVYIGIPPKILENG